jgi:hypothetical protein
VRSAVVNAARLLPNEQCFATPPKRLNPAAYAHTGTSQG